MNAIKTKLYDDIYNLRKEKCVLEDQLKRVNNVLSELQRTIKEQ
jgi:hypothetical protein